MITNTRFHVLGFLFALFWSAQAGAMLLKFEFNGSSGADSMSGQFLMDTSLFSSTSFTVGSNLDGFDLFGGISGGIVEINGAAETLSIGSVSSQNVLDAFYETHFDGGSFNMLDVERFAIMTAAEFSGSPDPVADYFLNASLFGGGNWTYFPAAGGAMLAGSIQSMSVQAVPLPATLLLFASGIIALTGFSRKTK